MRETGAISAIAWRSYVEGFNPELLRRPERGEMPATSSRSALFLLPGVTAFVSPPVASTWQTAVALCVCVVQHVSLGGVPHSCVRPT